MRGLFMSIHLFSVGLSLVLVGIYAPLYWSITLYILFAGSLYACENCKRRAKRSVAEAIIPNNLSKEEGLVVLSKTEKAIQQIIKNKHKKK